MQDKVMSHDKIYTVFVMQQKCCLNYLVCQHLMHNMNAWNISNLHLACDKVGLIRV